VSGGGGRGRGGLSERRQSQRGPGGDSRSRDSGELLVCLLCVSSSFLNDLC
jgi:hypothetical protein